MNACQGFFCAQPAKSSKSVNSLNDKILDCLWIACLNKKYFYRIDTMIWIILVKIIEKFYSGFAVLCSGICPLI